MSIHSLKFTNYLVNYVKLNFYLALFSVFCEFKVSKENKLCAEGVYRVGDDCIRIVWGLLIIPDVLLAISFLLIMIQYLLKFKK